MGEVISLDQHRRARSASGGSGRGAAGPGTPEAVTFAFDVASPWTYLAAERVERGFPGAVWLPVAPEGPCAATARADSRKVIEDRAAALGMPLVWPDGDRDGGRVARRAAAWAAERGQAPAFTVAACRLAYCGGFDLDDPDFLQEAAAAAGLNVSECLEACGDAGADAALAAAGRALRAQGAERLPVLSTSRGLFCGEERLAEAAAAMRAPAAPVAGDGWAG